MKRILIIIILLVFLASPAYGRDRHNDRGHYQKPDRMEEQKPIDKYYYQPDSDYNWKYKYIQFKAPRNDDGEDYRWRDRDDDYRWGTDRKLNMRSNKKHLGRGNGRFKRVR